MEETKNEEIVEEKMSDDEAYAKLETEKLLHRKKKRKIITSIAMGLAFALAIVVIVLSTVPANLKPTCLEDDYVTVRFSDDAGTLYGGVYSKNEASQKKNFEKFEKLLDESFAQTYISAIFSGSLANQEFVEKISLSWNVAKEELLEKGQRFVSLEYENAKTLKYQNGDKFISAYYSKDTTVTFKNVWITVSDKEGFVDTKIYFNVSYPDETNKLITFTVRANTYKIYKEFGSLVGWF